MDLSSMKSGEVALGNTSTGDSVEESFGLGRAGDKNFDQSGTVL